MAKSKTSKAGRQNYTQEQKIFLVKCLAQYFSYTEVQSAIAERFDGLEVPTTTIQHYDPRYEPQPAAQWLEIYDAERKRFNASLDAQPMESQAWRQKARWRAAQQAAKMGNLALLKDLLADGSRESTGGFGRRVEVSGPGGGPIETRDHTVPIDKAPAKLKRAILAWLETMAADDSDTESP